jgi:hypothetical protein
MTRSEHSTTHPTPPKSASSLYQTLHQTALSFVDSLKKAEDGSPFNEPLFRSVRTSNYYHLFGHNHFVSTAPHLQGEKDLEGFISHVISMMPKLEKYDSNVEDIMVDESKRAVVLRATYYMKPMGAEQAVENDLVWWLWMDESGKKVERSTEFVDAFATMKLGQMLSMVKG